MGAELFDKWLAHYDPIHRGYTPRGLANGLTATNGWSFPRVGGGYNLYRGVLGGGAAKCAESLIDWNQPVGAAGGGMVTIGNFPWRVHAADTSYVYGLRAIGGGGVESGASYPARAVSFDGGGNLLGPRPNVPSGLVVRAKAGGRFELRWMYVSRFEESVPAVFEVYEDGGTGTVDFATAVGTVGYRPGKSHYEFLSAAVGHDVRRSWSVRAVTAAGDSDGNVVVVAARSDAESPVMLPELVGTRLGEE